MKPAKVSSVATYFATKFPEAYGNQYTDAASLVLPNLPNGSSWALINEKNPNAKIVKEIMSWNSDNRISVFQLANGYLVYLDFQELAASIQNTVPVLPQEFLVQGYARLNDANVSFQGMLMKSLQKQKKNLTVGIFCTNDSSKIVIKGVTYNAYNLDIDRFLTTLIGTGYSVVYNGNPVDPQSAMSNVPELMKSFTIAPSSNGVMVDLVYVG